MSGNFFELVTENPFSRGIPAYNLAIECHADDGVARTFENGRQSGMRLLSPLPFDRESDCANDNVAADLSLEQKILRSFAKRLQGHILVFKPGQHYNGQVGKIGAQSPHRLQSTAVWQPQVEHRRF